jgi:hypothetical protein
MNAASQSSREDDRRIDVGFVQAALHQSGRKVSAAEAEKFWSDVSRSYGSEWKRLDNYSLADVAMMADEVEGATSH